MILALGATVFRYVDQHFYDEDTFIENTSSLVGNQEIRERIFEGFLDEIITLADGEDVDADEPTDLGSLFGDQEEDEDPELDPVTDERIERNQAIEQILVDALESDLYVEVFNDSLVRTRAQLERSAELEDIDLLGDSGQINFDMQRLYPPIWSNLQADPRTRSITENELPATAGIFSVGDRETTVDTVWSALGGGPRWRTPALALSILALIIAVAVADRRPSTVVMYGGGLILVAAVVLVTAYIIRALLPLMVGSGSSAGPVSAVYWTNIWPLIVSMIRLAIIGAVIAALGALARLIWPDDWVYDHVNGDSGVTSIKRRRGKGATAEPAQQQAAMAPVPVGYPGYPPGYAPYPPQWSQPYAQPYPPQYPPPGYAYPPGPYAQPQPEAIAATYTPGRPTVPVVPVVIDATDDDGPDEVTVVDGESPGVSVAVVPDLPPDAAGVVPAVDTAAPPAPAADAPPAPKQVDDWSAESDW